MSPIFKRLFHKLNSENPTNWQDSKLIQKILCIPLSLIFSHIPINHINYFSLDVEGAEVSVLESIDFTVIKFDIISVEIEKAFRPADHEQKVTELLLSHGYLKIWCKGRNAWFRHREYELKSRDKDAPLGGCLQ